MIPFMDPGTALFKRTLMISGFGLVVCVICGLIYHFAKASLKCRQGKGTFNCWFSVAPCSTMAATLKGLGHQLGMRITNNCQRPLTR